MARKITARKAAKYRRLIVRAKLDFEDFRAGGYYKTHRALYENVVLSPLPYFRTYMNLLTREPDEEILANIEKFESYAPEQAAI